MLGYTAAEMIGTNPERLHDLDGLPTLNDAPNALTTHSGSGQTGLPAGGRRCPATDGPNWPGQLGGTSRRRRRLFS
jgi:hypothetical protein